MPKDQNKPADPAQAGGEAPAGVPIEEQLFMLWNRYRSLVIAFVVLVLAVMIGREVVQVIAARREAAIRSAFIAATTPEAQRSFARDHRQHPLSGVAYLSLADEAYEAGAWAVAHEDYSRAAEILRDPVLSGRAAIGRAVSLILAGDAARGEELLRQAANDPRFFLSARNEARYHAAVLAMDRRDYSAARQWIDEILQSDLSGVWAQRALGLRGTIPEPASEAEAALAQ